MQVVKLLISLLICFLPGLIGSRITSKAIPEWYNYLKKPAFTPPNWLFGPAWTALYALMGIGLFLIWRKGISSFAVKIALIFFAIQLVINAIWSPVFFGLRSPGFGLMVIVALWIAIVFTIRHFLPISRTAGFLLIPYLAWVSYALVLNLSIYTLNR
ncbi:MAG: TspO/MBR family protein [bacterium]